MTDANPTRGLPSRSPTSDLPQADAAFTPALGRLVPARYLDLAVAMTRERLWRALTVAYVAPRPDEVIVDVGCGTGSLAALLRSIEPGAHVVGVDPDPDVLTVARRKADGVVWHVGRGDALVERLGAESADTVVSTLVLHQCPLAVKRAMLAAAHAVLRPGGRLVIADYGRQRTTLMRAAFRLVQCIDGHADTQPNADGVLPTLIAEAGFGDVREVEVVTTVTGSISVYVALKE
ncbi:class I SAM-dependent methyltransferase [Tsukamurella soli]|uniref:Class I SAM-dependent methyltransferase n=1 Tax=Tsukamurella soli TaxID=644556 RepID=A0ABP8JCL1_9ACTN